MGPSDLFVEASQQYLRCWVRYVRNTCGRWLHGFGDLLIIVVGKQTGSYSKIDEEIVKISVKCK